METTAHKIEVYYIRHGQSKWNEDEKLDMSKPYGAAFKHKVHEVMADRIKMGASTLGKILQSQHEDGYYSKNETNKEEIDYAEKWGVNIPKLENEYLDAKLTTQGEEEAYCVANWFAQERDNSLKNFDFMFFTSPLQRAFKTLMIAAEPLGIRYSKVIIDPHLREPGNIDCQTSLFSKQPKHYEAHALDAIVKPNLDSIMPLLESVLGNEVPIIRKNFEFRDQLFRPKGKYKLSKTLFRQIFTDMKRESLETGKNAIVIGGHSLVMKNGLASILSSELTNIHKVKEKSKKIASNFLNSFLKMKPIKKLKSKIDNKREEEEEESSTESEMEMTEEFSTRSGKRKIKIYTVWKEEWLKFATTKLPNGAVLNFSLTFHEDESIEVGFPQVVFACPEKSENLTEEF